MNMILEIGIAFFFIVIILTKLCKLAKITNAEYEYSHLYYKEVYVLLKKRKNVRYFEKKVMVLNNENIDVWSSMELALEMQNRAVKLLSQYDELKVVNLFGLCKQEKKELKKIEKEVSLLWIQSIGIEN